MNKAELEVQVVKLERSLARARAQTAELKQALKEAQQPATTTPAKTSKKATRTKAEIAAAEEAQDTEAAQSDE